MLGHATPLRALVPSMSTTLHAFAPSLGPVDTTAWPSLSTAIHRFALGQDTAMSPFGLESVAICQTAGFRGMVVAVVVVGATVVVVSRGGLDGTAVLLEEPEEQPAAAKVTTRRDATLARRAQ
jgi:hypothetical protein